MAARKNKPKKSAKTEHRSCPKCGKLGFNSRSHPKHLSREERAVASAKKRRNKGR